MSDLRTAAQQALECLKGVARGKYDGNAAEVCVALEAALAEQRLTEVQQEMERSIESLKAASAQEQKREQAEPICKCDLRTRLVGDGCEVCNPALAEELAQEQAEPVQPVATMTECEACFTPDVCQLRGTCDHYAASQLRVAAQPKPPAEPVQEPVAWVRLEAWKSGKDWPDDCFTALPAEGLIPLYTAPLKPEPVQEPTLQTCNCRWDGEVQVQQCTLHEAHIDAIHEWAERAKVAEKKLAALAEPVQEPVAFIHRQGNHWEVSERHLDEDETDRGWTEEPLYTAPPKLVPLTEEEMRGLADDYLSYQAEGYEASGVFALIRAVERALEAKNGR